MLIAAAFDPRFDADGVYLLSMDGGRSPRGEPIELNTFFIVEGGALFGAKQRGGPVIFRREPLSKEIVSTLTREDLDDPVGLVNMLRSGDVTIKRFA